MLCDSLEKFLTVQYFFAKPTKHTISVLCNDAESEKNLWCRFGKCNPCEMFVPFLALQNGYDMFSSFTCGKIGAYVIKTFALPLGIYVVKNEWLKFHHIFVVSNQSVAAKSTHVCCCYRVGS